MQTSRFKVIAFLMLTALIFSASPAAPSAQAAPLEVPALTLAAAFAENPTWVTGATFVHEANNPTTAVFSAPSTGFPTGTDGSFIGMSSGTAANMPMPGANIDTGFGDSFRGVNDVTILSIGLDVPVGTDCLVFNTQFFSEEFPTYIGSEFNDAFVAELDVNDWSVAGTTINAPHNFALAPGNKILSINSGLAWSPALAAGTAFVTPHGGTEVLAITTPITPGAHTLYLSVWDMGDDSLDSAVYLDNLRLFNSGGTCTTGIGPTTPSPTITGLVPNSGPTTGGTSVVITGTDFTGATAVTFGGTAGASFTVDSATQITAVTPTHAPTLVDVSVTTPGGTDTATNAFTFYVKSVPLPDTGFAQGRITHLPAQPAEKAYADLGSLWLEVPELDIQTPIVGVPAMGDGWDVTWLGDNAGYLEASAFPTWEGNTVLTGHVWDSHNRPGVFANLRLLSYGDQVKIHAWGRIYTYEVRYRKLISPFAPNSVFQHFERDWVTLFTCEDYRYYLEDYSFRRVVQAVLVDISAER